MIVRKSLILDRVDSVLPRLARPPEMQDFSHGASLSCSIRPRRLAAGLGIGHHAQAPDPQALEFFERKIRPVLVEQCYSAIPRKLRNAKKLKGGLLLDTAAGLLAGGDSGPAIVAGNPDESLLIKALSTMVWRCRRTANLRIASSPIS